ncbi:MAG: polyphosphate kinase 2 [Rhodospirillaceae bacterium]|nr:polyphosphate kinase 2 [Rhodospirillaceae bacterium]
MSDLINLQGIGPKTTLLLTKSGINTVRKLSRANPSRLKKLTGLSQKQCKKMIFNAKVFMNPHLAKNTVDSDWIKSELEDFFDEELELEMDDYRVPPGLEDLVDKNRKMTLDRRIYFRALLQLQNELIKLQDWVVENQYKLVVIFEGRDAAGKGGVIKRITQRLDPRICRVVALPAPNNRQKTQWYFQRFVEHLPAGGEIILFDRSWYNRAGVERVMKFANKNQVNQFFNDVPEFERMLSRSGIKLIKYWFSITDQEQQLRFMTRVHDPLKQWKLSPMDLQSRIRWEEYTKVKEEMILQTNIPEAPWFIVEGNDKKRARLNCMAHLLSLVPYKEIKNKKIKLPKRIFNQDYERGVLPENLYVPEKY